MTPRGFYNFELETLPRDRLRELQSGKLRGLADQLVTNEFYCEKLSRAGVTLASIRELDDLKLLPFTTKRELIDEQAAHPPFGRLLTYPRSRYRYFHQTSGTTGRPLRWLDTEDDWSTLERCWQYVYRAAGVTERDTVFLAFSFGPYLGHWAGIQGAWATGALCVSGGGMNSEQRLLTILENECTVLVCTPTYALHLAEVAERSGIDIKSSAVRIGIHTGEPGASVPNIKRKIEESWGATCFDHAGATEVGAWGFDCLAQTGAIHLNELEFIFEVISPETCEPVEEGQRGELVITNLGRPGMPVLKYRTGDLVELTTAPCECGRTLARIRGGVLGRIDDMLVIRGVNLYPSAVDNIIRAIDQILEYEVEIRRIEGLDDLLLKVEVADDTEFDDVRRSLINAFRVNLNIRVGVQRAASGTLPRYELKARRFKRIAE